MGSTKIIKEELLLQVFMLVCINLSISGTEDPTIHHIPGVFGGNVSLSCPFISEDIQDQQVGSSSYLGTHQQFGAALSSNKILQMHSSYTSSSTSESDEQRASLVMWFHNSDTDPFYSYDTRMPDESPRHWVSDQYADKVSLNFSDQNGVRLNIINISHVDQGSYRCRVDYSSSPTQNIHFNISLVVPPEKPVLVDQMGKNIGKYFGPFQEGDKLSVSCEVTGGSPKPYIFWLKNGKKMTASGQVSSGNTITSRLEIPVLTREDSETTLSCLTNNNQLSKPLIAQTVINILVAPSRVEITERNRKLVVGKSYNFTCAAQEFYPSVDFTWYLNHKRIPTTNYTKDFNISKVEIRMTRALNKKELICKAENPKLHGLSISDSIILDVFYPPVLHLEIGQGLDVNRVMEGTDLYLECYVESRPGVPTVQWFRNDARITSNELAGVIVTKNSLVLQNISRSRSGKYFCYAENSEGNATSHQIQVNVQYGPECEYDHMNIILHPQSNILVNCDMLGYPTARGYHWKFKNKKYEVDIPSSMYEDYNNASLLAYSVHSEEDYGNLTCLAHNSAGLANKPCTYTIQKPGGVGINLDCELELHPTGDAHLYCKRENITGIYSLQIYRLENLKSIYRNLSSSKPNFTVQGLSGGQMYLARLDFMNPTVGRWSTLFNFTSKTEWQNGPIIDPLQESLPSIVQDSPEPIQPITPVPLKSILILLVIIGFIFTIFLASVGVMCKIKCQYVSGDRGSERSLNTVSQEEKPSHNSQENLATSPIHSVSSFLGEYTPDGVTTKKVHEDSRSFDESTIRRSFSTENMTSYLQLEPRYPFDFSTMPRRKDNGQINPLAQFGEDGMSFSLVQRRPQNQEEFIRTFSSDDIFNRNPYTIRRANSFHNNQFTPQTLQSFKPDVSSPGLVDCLEARIPVPLDARIPVPLRGQGGPSCFTLPSQRSSVPTSEGNCSISVPATLYYPLQNGYLPFTDGRTLYPVSYGQLPQSAAYMQNQLISGQNQLLSGPMSPPCPCLSGGKPTQESTLSSSQEHTLSSSQEHSYTSDEDKISDTTDQTSTAARTVKFSDLDTVHEDDSC